MKNVTKEGNSLTLNDVRAAAIVAGFVLAFAIGAVMPFIAHADSNDNGSDNPGFVVTHENNGHNDGDHNNDGHGDNGHGHDGCDQECDNGDNGDGGDTTPPPPPPPPQTGGIAIIKNTVGGDGTFSFGGSNSFTITTIGGVGEQDFFNIPSGAYMLTETAQDGWTLTSNSCTDGFTVVANATTTCTIVNTKNPVTPIDVCPNIADVQTSVAEGMTLNTDGQCVSVTNGGGGETTPPPAPPAPTPAPTGGGNGPIAGSLGTGGGGSIFGGGQVLGASTSTVPISCVPLLHTYMRFGKHNDSSEVKLLQQFLNKQLGLKLTVNGIFGKDTDAAVRAFQKQNFGQVLTPWGISDSTGYIYKTTQRWINLMNCASLNIPMPELN